MNKPLITTDRLVLYNAVKEDAVFVLELLNTPKFLKNIGDRKVRDLTDAENYILENFVGSYESNGFGLWIVREIGQQTAIGLCGLVKRQGLDNIDIGFAFLPNYEGKGYAYEAAQACMDYARNDLMIEKVIAIVSPGNEGSIKLLKKLGLSFEKEIVMSGNDHVHLYS